MNDTPRTDEFRDRGMISALRGFARTLERELAAVIKQRDDAVALNEQYHRTRQENRLFAKNAQEQRDDWVAESNKLTAELSAVTKERDALKVKWEAAETKATEMWQLADTRTAERDNIQVQLKACIGASKDMHAAIAVERDRLREQLAAVTKERDALKDVESRVLVDRNYLIAENIRLSAQASYCDELTAERDRLRSALDELISLTPPIIAEGYVLYHGARKRAKAALGKE